MQRSLAQSTPKRSRNQLSPESGPTQTTKKPLTDDSTHTEFEESSISLSDEMPNTETGIAPDSEPTGDNTIALALQNISSSIAGLKLELVASINDLEKKFDAVAANWQVEKQEIIAKQCELEARLDRMERQEKRNNIVITGLKSADGDKVKAAVNSLFTNNLGQTVTINDAFQLMQRSGDTRVIVKLSSWDDKMKIMRSKSKLPKDVFVNDDLILKDRQLRGKAVQYAKSIRKDGMKIQIRNNHVIVDGIRHLWDETTNTFTERKN